jgi:hypothetical protein
MTMNINMNMNLNTNMNMSMNKEMGTDMFEKKLLTSNIRLQRYWVCPEIGIISEINIVSSLLSE